MARKSTNSNKRKNVKRGDSLPDSDEIEAAAVETEVSDEAPVVIEGEAEDITEVIAEAEEAEESADNSEVEPVDEGASAALSDSNEAQAPEIESTERSDVEDEPATVPPAVVADPERSSVMPLVFGGLIAGAIGFGASHFGVLNQEQAPSVDTSAFDARFDALSSDIGSLTTDYSGLANEVAELAPTDTALLTERLEVLSTDLDVLSTNVEALQNGVAPIAEVPATLIERIDTLEADIGDEIASLGERLSGLEDRLSDMQIAEESAPNPTDAINEDQLAAFQSELDQLTAQAKAQVEQATAQVEEAALEVSEAKARASEFEQKAADAAALAETKGAIAALVAAVENGSGFTEELAFFDDPPKALTATAENGVPTLSALQRDFPDMARAALATATVVPQGASAGDRLAAFLKRQTNARSLAPKEGDGTDAVLSRAEASVAQGDLEGSLAELSSLPDETKEVLAPWMTNVQTRLDALAALTEISAAEN